jgi:MoaA/NifB/PqqE/SkfB family radical SAM enzyme
MSYSPFRHLGAVFSKRPLHLTFFVTQRCNTRCPFCFYLAGKEKGNVENELSLDEIKLLSSSMPELLWLALSGGEIFLRDDLVEIAKAFYENNRPAIILMPTNGMMPARIEKMTREILAIARNSTVVVKLSLDSADEKAHDSLRGMQGSFSKTMETYERLGRLLDRHSNFELGMNSVFCSLNQDGMGPLIEFAKGLKMIKTHTVSLVRGTVPEELKRVDMNKYRQTAEQLCRDLRQGQASTYRFRGARLKAAQDILQRNLIERTAKEKKALLPCYAGRLNLVLTETGDVHPCELLSEKMGNIKEFDFDMGKLLKGNAARDVVKKIQETNCHCTHECYMMTNILFNPRMYPSLLKEYVRLLL